MREDEFYALTPRAFYFLELSHWRKIERQAELQRPFLSMFYNAHRGKGPSKSAKELWPLQVDNLFEESREDYEERMKAWIDNLPKGMKKAK